jgi:hypothetical protein
LLLAHRRAAAPENAMAMPTTNLPSFDDFAAQSRAAGFPEVLERRWNPGVEVAQHGHPFALEALVVEGDMWLTIGNATRHLRPGDRFALARQAPHAERYGDSGAVYWVARRG